MESKTVSKKLLYRLPLYLNYLKGLEESVSDVSAPRIAGALNLGDVLVRKDLAKVSNEGRRRRGYPRENLIRDIEAFLDVHGLTCAVIVGAGKLGQALMDYSGFEESGLQILAGFDVKPSAPRTEGGKPIYDISLLAPFCELNTVPVGIITVPAERAQQACDKLVECGVKAILNYAPVYLRVPEHVVVQHENLAVSLTTLLVQLKNQTGIGEQDLENVSGF